MRDRRRADQDEPEGWERLARELHHQLGDDPDDQDQRRAAECWPDQEDLDVWQPEHGRASHRE